MIEVHGWAKLALSLDGENEEGIAQNIEALMPIINEAGSVQCLIDIFALNGSYYLNVSGSLNHHSAELDEVMSIFNLLANDFKGSYGLIYLRNDESPEIDNNRFVVYKLAKGILTQEVDSLLSPCIPTIED